MAFLLDTNIIIWLGYGNPELPTKVSELLLSGSAPIFISVVSGWEYEQKRKLRPDEFSLPFSEVILEIPHQPLDFEFAVYRYASSLPLIHRDPFDRMLIAQALAEPLRLVTHDALLEVIQELLGDDILVYGTLVFYKPPRDQGSRHICSADAQQRGRPPADFARRRCSARCPCR